MAPPLEEKQSVATVDEVSKQRLMLFHTEITNFLRILVVITRRSPILPLLFLIWLVHIFFSDVMTKSKQTLENDLGLPSALSQILQIFIIDTLHEGTYTVFRKLFYEATEYFSRSRVKYLTEKYSVPDNNLAEDDQSVEKSYALHLSQLVQKNHAREKTLDVAISYSAFLDIIPIAIVTLRFNPTSTPFDQSLFFSYMLSHHITGNPFKLLYQVSKWFVDGKRRPQIFDLTNQYTDEKAEKQIKALLKRDSGYTDKARLLREVHDFRSTILAECENSMSFLPIGSPEAFSSKQLTAPQAGNVQQETIFRIYNQYRQLQTLILRRFFEAQLAHIQSATSISIQTNEILGDVLRFYSVILLFNPFNCVINSMAITFNPKETAHIFFKSVSEVIKTEDYLSKGVVIFEGENTVGFCLNSVFSRKSLIAITQMLVENLEALKQKKYMHCLLMISLAKCIPTIKHGLWVPLNIKGQYSLLLDRLSDTDEAKVCAFYSDDKFNPPCEIIRYSDNTTYITFNDSQKNRGIIIRKNREVATTHMPYIPSNTSLPRQRVIVYPPANEPIAYTRNNKIKTIVTFVGKNQTFTYDSSDKNCAVANYYINCYSALTDSTNCATPFIEDKFKRVQRRAKMAAKDDEQGIKREPNGLLVLKALGEYGNTRIPECERLTAIDNHGNYF